jgi:hypothetical protein
MSIDASARDGQRQRSDGRQPVGMGDVAAPLVEGDAHLQPLTCRVSSRIVP